MIKNKRRQHLQVFILFMICILTVQEVFREKTPKETFDPNHSKKYAEKFIENEFQEACLNVFKQI